MSHDTLISESKAMAADMGGAAYRASRISDVIDLLGDVERLAKGVLDRSACQEGNSAWAQTQQLAREIVGRIQRAVAEDYAECIQCNAPTHKAELDERNKCAACIYDDRLVELAERREDEDRTSCGGYPR